MNDRYLWDRSGPPDPEIRRLEMLLGRFRHGGDAHDPFRRRIPRAAIAAAAILLLAAAGLAVLARKRSEWTVRAVAGTPSVASAAVTAPRRLAPGDSLETNASSRARLDLPGVGRVEVEPRSRLRLIDSRLTEQRLALDAGAIRAKIWAPPRLFFVETPSALAVDLGCEYSLEVDSEGRGLLRVETGWVSFEHGRRASIVPAGAACATRPGIGPGTPFAGDAAPALRDALERFDFGAGGAEDLAALLAAARRKDGLTLWHLLARTEGSSRDRVYERLAALVPPPAGVTREGALALDEDMLERWRWELEGMPWLPRNASVGSFLRKLWFWIAGN